MIPHYSWLHHEATVTSVEVIEAQDHQLFQILAILSESSKEKLIAKFGDVVLKEASKAA